MASRSTPRTVLQIAPMPPKMLVPPSATAAMLASTRVAPLSLPPEDTVDASMTPARPAAAPQITNVITRMRSTRTPELRAASALPPIAKTYLPKTVRVSSSCSTIATAAKMITDHVSLPKPPVPSVPNAVSLTEIGKPFVIAAPAPENTRLVASVARNELIPSVVEADR